MKRDRPHGPAGRGPGRRAPRAHGAKGRSSGSRVVWPPQERESARDAIEQLMRARGLARRFGGAVEKGARRACARGLDIPVGGPPRHDLRELSTFTIDPASARDFDDAVSAEWADGKRAVRVWIHIADVSAHVREGSPVDVEARLRATSVYVPGAVEPMLPHALSSDACSLMPARDRLAVTVELEVPVDDVDREGARATEPRFYRSLIRSDARLDYDHVDRIFAGRTEAAEPWAEPLAAARAAARALGRARARRPGNLFVDSEEPEFEFDDRGEVAAIRTRPQTESHRLIEHLMIAANEAVAQTLRDHRVATLYRVHERPHVERVLRLVDQLATLDVPTPPVPDGLTRAGAAALVGEISRRVEDHVRRTVARARAGDRSVSPTGARRALTALVLRSLQQAHYSPRDLGHAGLGSPCYCHFTSPIRRYPDLVCHRALLSLLGHAERAPRASDLAELGEWCSERERAAIEIERDGDDVARCFALERLLHREGHDHVFAGEVVGLIGAGAFVAFGGEYPASVDALLDARGYEGMLPARVLSAPPTRDWWELNEEGTVLSAQRTGAALRLGDPVAVRVDRVDAPRGRVDLVPAALAPAASTSVASPARSPASSRSPRSPSSAHRRGKGRGGRAR